MSASLDALDSTLRQPAHAFVDAIGAAGYLPQVTSTLRTYSEQSRLYRRYVQGLSQYPAAKPGTSAHEYGFAFDLIVSPMSALSYIGSVWESWGGVWGGHYGDEVHFEAPGFTLGSSAPASAYAPATTPDMITKVADFVATLFPGVDALAVAGFVLQQFPDFGQAELAYYLQHPYSFVKLIYGF